MSTQTIGRYEIKRELGRGGMSTVVHAYDPRFKRDVAIKILPREFLHDPLFRARFEREAETIAALEHPAIVPVYDFGEDTGQLFLVMRYMGGGSLADRIEKGPLSLSKTVTILERLAPALDKAHSLGVVHRDLKSANILFDEDENSFLSDFGIAKLTETSFGLTGTGSMIGTPAYMSPEQARGDPAVDGRSDIYSLGVILFEMLTGELPFEADTPMGIAIKHITDPVPRVLHFQPDLPPRCEAVILRAMNKEPASRYPTCEEMVHDLTMAVTGELSAKSTNPGAPAVYVKPPDTKELPAVGRRGRRISFMGWIVSGIAIVGLVAFMVFGGGSLFGGLNLFSGIPVPGLLPTSGGPTDEPTGEPTSAVSTEAATIGSTSPTSEPSTTQPPTTQPPTTRPPTTQPPTIQPTPVPVITPTPGPSGPALGGGNGLMLFISGPEGEGNLYAANLSCIDTPELCGAGLTQYTKDTLSNRRPVLSPDAKKIAFDGRLATAGNVRNIFVMDVDGTHQQQLTTSDSNDYSASWSPDGTKIVFVSERDGSAQLYVMDSSGENQTRITHDIYDDLSPAWSPDGKKILFHSRRNGNIDIYTLNASCIPNPATCDNAQIRLTTDSSPDYNAVWSPDGSRILFVSERDGNPDIYVMNANGQGQTRLTDNPFADFSPAWSPDAKFVLFVSKRITADNPGELPQIYVMDADGKNVRPVTKIDASNLDPVFVP